MKSTFRSLAPSLSLSLFSLSICFAFFVCTFRNCHYCLWLFHRLSSGARLLLFLSLRRQQAVDPNNDSNNNNNTTTTTATVCGNLKPKPPTNDIKWRQRQQLQAKHARFQNHQHYHQHYGSYAAATLDSTHWYVPRLLLHLLYSCRGLLLSFIRQRRNNQKEREREKEDLDKAEKKQFAMEHEIKLHAKRWRQRQRQRWHRARQMGTA